MADFNTYRDADDTERHFKTVDGDGTSGDPAVPAHGILDSAGGEVLGTTSASAYAGSGNTTLIAALKGLYALLEDIVGAQSCAYTYTAAGVTTSSSVVLAGNASRKYLLLQNDSDTTIYIKSGASAAVVNEGIRIPSGGSFEASLLQGNLLVSQITAIHGGSGTKTLLITEGA